MKIISVVSGQATLVFEPDEIQALVGSLLETHYQISDDVAYSARIGVPKEYARALWVQLRDLQREVDS